MLSKGLALKRRSAMVTLLTAARLLRAECSPPVDPITREWYCPQARIPGLLTFRPLDRFRPSCVFDQHCSGVWCVCHIPPGKLPIHFDNLQMHNRQERADCVREDCWLIVAPLRSNDETSEQAHTAER